MPQIRILPEQLANRIAAGEVVERPASVVKELVENSIDAGANRIEIDIEGGGKRLIRILDNGCGMDEDDVLLSFERHGTSKINDDNDLAAIHTLGFRGEAIPSIASVSKIAITSRPRNSEFGTQVEFDYGRLQKVHETGCSQGTTIEVRNLFGRTPARKKFLRTKRTELSHIDEIVKNYGLGCPHIAFTLRIDGRETITLNSGHNLEERFRIIQNYTDELIPVSSDSKGSFGRKLTGYLVPPDKPLPGSARVRLFINGRAIKDRVMHHAVIEGLRGFLLKNHSPAGYLHLQLKADEVDVNVHPAKHEVRFHDSRSVHQFIQQNIEGAMLDYQHSLRSDLLAPTSPIPTEYDDAGKKSLFRNDDGSTPAFTVKEKKPAHNYSPTVAKTILSAAEKAQPPYHQSIQPTLPPPIPSGAQKFADDSPSPFQLPTKEKEEPTVHHGMQIIGQLKNLYIFCQAGENLLVIDQHAAHERLLYEKLRKQYMDGRVVSQSLLFPETVELSPFQIQLVETNKDILEKLGLTIREFGGNSYIISAVPAIPGTTGAKEIFFDVLDAFGDEPGKRSVRGKLDNLLAGIACKAAIKSGQELTHEEIDELLNKMARADLFSHCPHGRPVLKKFTQLDIKKWFHRT